MVLLMLLLLFCDVGVIGIATLLVGVANVLVGVVAIRFGLGVGVGVAAVCVGVVADRVLVIRKDCFQVKSKFITDV